MRQMTIEQINEHTTGRNVTTRLCVYMTTRETVGLLDSDGDPKTIGLDFIDLPKGVLLPRYGCGDLNQNGPNSKFVFYYYKLKRDVAITVSNLDVMHYANDILPEAPEDYPA